MEHARADGYALVLASVANLISLDDPSDQLLPVPVAALCGVTDIVATLPSYGHTPRLERSSRWCSRFEDVPGHLRVSDRSQDSKMAFTIVMPDQPRFQLPTAFLVSFEMMLGA